MNNSIVPSNFEPPQVIVVDTTDKEEDLKENSEEVENTEGSEDFENSMDFDGPEYYQDLEDFDLWDDQSVTQDLISIYVDLWDD